MRGVENLPCGPEQAISFQASGSAEEIRDFRGTQMGSLRGLSDGLKSERDAIGAGLTKEGPRTTAKINLPLLAEFLCR